MNIRRRGWSLGKGVKDYIVPIVGVILLAVVLFSIFWTSSSTETTKIEIENKIWLAMSLDSETTEGVIVYPWNYKKKIEWNIDIYKWEKVILKNWTASFSLATIWNIKLNKLWELKYLENGNLQLLSSDMWLNSASKISVDMRFAKVKVWENTNISFSQNEMWSTIYLLNGFAEVSNLVGESTVLDSWQKLTISRIEASKTEFDLSLQKSLIDDFYKQSDWFILNNWKKYLATKQDSVIAKTWTWTVKVETDSKLIKLTNIFDDSNVSSDTINISWTFQDEEITKIILNWVEAKIDKKLKTFIFENISVSNSENDLVFKVYDDANDVLSKFVYTVYYDGAEVKNTWWWAFSVKTFDVDGTKFTFTSPTSKNTFTTYVDFVTIRWSVLEKWIEKVIINWYTLRSFKGSTWRYHASALNNNLSLGTNVYEIKYFGPNNKLVYTNHFTIVRKKPSEKKVVIPKPKVEKKVEEPTPVPEKKTYSDEAKTN